MERAKKSRHYALHAFKLIASIVFILIILKFVRIDDIATHFKSLDLRYTLALFPLSFVAILVSCLKWRLLLREHRHDISVWYLCSLYLVGYFFSNFLPSMVGGDAARGYLLGRRINSFNTAYVSVLIERLTGLFALIALVTILTVSNHPAVQVGSIRLTLVILTLGLIIALVTLFSRNVFTVVLSLVPNRLARLKAKLDEAHQRLISFRDERSDLGLVMLLSLSFHLLTGLNVYLACHALRFPAELMDLILITPLIILVSLLPLSMNGIGLWEGSFVLFLGLVGVPQSIAVSAALLLRLKTLIISGLGWFVYFTYRHQPGGDTLRKDINSLDADNRHDNRGIER